MKHLFILILILIPFSLHARREGVARVDSLIQQLPKTTQDSDKIKLLYNISYSYSSLNPIEGIKYGKQDSELAKKTNWQKGLLLANTALGVNCSSIGDYQNALTYFFNTLKIAKESGSKDDLARTLANIGFVYQRLSNYPAALKYNTESLNINEGAGNKQEMAENLINIGLVYQSQGNYPNAMEFDLNANKIYAELKDKNGIANSLNSIGVLYIDQQNFTKALEYFFKALEMNKERDDKNNMAENYTNIGNAYISQGNYNEALSYYNKALAIYKEQDNKTGIARDLGNIGDVYVFWHDYSKSLEYLSEALDMHMLFGDKLHIANNLGDIGCVYLSIATDTTLKNHTVPGNIPNLRKAVEYLTKAVAIDKEIGSLNELQNFAYHLSTAQKLLGNYKDALESYSQYATAKDSVYSLYNNMKIAKLEEKHEADIKQKKIALQQLQIRLYLAFVGMLIIACIGLFNRFWSLRTNKKQLEEKNKLIIAEKENADILRIRAERSEQFKQQFLANMSHEIRTPMNAVNGMTELLLEKNPRPDQRHYLEVISKSSDILLHILNDILDLSKIEVGKMELEAIDFSLAATIQHVKDTLSFRAEEKGLQLVSHVDEFVPDVFIGDSFRLYQVLLNLAGNAIKFTERGYVSIDVHLLEETSEKSTLEFSVTDTGIGIPADKMSILFENFTQLNASDRRKYGGTGLGLSISRQLVELQGGRMWVRSTPGKGSSFYFTLSYKTGLAERLLLQEQKQQQADGGLLKGLRLLLADDNEFNRLVVTETLRIKADMIIDEVTNGAEAVKMLEQKDYDVILMDVQMPEMSGLEATQYIRKHLPAPKNEVPIIALTANIFRSEIDECYASGMNSYLPKPCKPGQLIAAIAEQAGRMDKAGSPVIIMEAKPPIVEVIGNNNAIITNLKYLTDFCEQDTKRMKKYIDVFIAAEPVFAGKMKAAIAENDIAEIALQVHGFKPKWMMMGMKQSTELGKTIEELCKQGENKMKIEEQLYTLMAQNNAAVKELMNR